MYKVILFLHLLPITIFAQTIQIQLPYYATRNYYFCLLEGTKQDTLTTGELDHQGKATVTLPADYRGTGRFSVEESGRIWNIIIGGNENIAMSEPDVQEATPVFKNSPENSFLHSSFAKQNKIINDYYQVANEPANKSFVLALPEQRMLALENEYKMFRKKICDSPLYAARLFEILSFLTGSGNSFNDSEEEVLAGQREFVVCKVDFDDLYTSGFWQQAFDVWYQATSITGQGTDSLLVSDSKKMLDHCGNIPVRHELVQTIIRLFSKYGKDNLLAELGTEYLTMPLNGQTAPEIITADGSFLPRQSLIIFYETGCGNCHYELEELKRKYDMLVDNSIRIISIAVDADKDVFVETAMSFPWTDKLCDFKGFNGENFLNYGIVGTPTYILTDKDSIVRGRYVQLRELLKE
jgi:thiol-disulfide isomerase/thioredoxin